MPHPLPPFSNVEIERLYARLIVAVRKAGVMVEEVPASKLHKPDIWGCCHGDQIYILTGLPPVERLAVLSHELGHHYLHYPYDDLKTYSDEWEFEADGVSRALFERLGCGRNFPPDWFAQRPKIGSMLALHTSEYYQARARTVVNFVLAMMDDEFA